MVAFGRAARTAKESQPQLAPIPLLQSVTIVRPQIVGLVAGSILLFVIAYVVFQRQEVRA
jgi:hypothetical protein